MRFKLILVLMMSLMASCSVNLERIPDAKILSGNDTIAYRDPAVVFENGKFYLFCTMVRIESDSIFSYVVESQSRNLVSWSEPRILTVRSQRCNFCSPGSIVKHDDEWVMCVCSYPRVNYAINQPIRYGDNTARCYIMRSRDLENWSDPELMRLKGPDVREEDMGRMIDAYITEDHDEPGKWWCFFKQNGVSMSYSYDLESWNYVGYRSAGENCSVIYDNEKGRYVLMHSPDNGMGLKYSTDLVNWEDDPNLITLGQSGWDWAKGRITAGALLDCRQELGKFLLFFHGSGPRGETTNGDFDRNCSIGLAWSDDLTNWSWPGSDKTE